MKHPEERRSSILGRKSPNSKFTLVPPPSGKMSSKPTFVFVPGAWHSASMWDKVITLLSKAAYKSVAVTLPSTSGDPAATFLNDIDAVRAAITSETSAGHDVILVVHSYGGHVGESALRDMPTRDRPDADAGAGAGKVLGLALIATGFNRAELSMIDGLGGKAPSHWRADTETGLVVLVADPVELFYHDMPTEEGRAWAARLQKQSTKSLFEGGEHAYPGWQDVPVWYLITVEDRGLPVEAQRWMLGNAREQGADVTAREIQSGHSPMLSRPEETVEFLMEAAKALEG